MANPIEYIVFEADQVLTNDHLNETFNYLDQQNRWTRNKLIGIGIVCGLDITINPGIIEVSKGCGVTSQGYLITQDRTQYTYYAPYSPADVPQDLPFTYPYGNLPFYKPFCTGKTIWTLITDAQFALLEPAQQSAAKTISSAPAGFLNDYVVVLFLETKEQDLKNCVGLDCNNKGEKMSFTVKPLLVRTADIPVAAKPIVISTIRVIDRPVLNLNLSHQIFFKRYNVPYSDLNNSDDVINGFVKIVDDTTLAQVASAYNFIYQQYSSILKVSANPFSDLFNTLKGYRDGILTNNPVFIEYFYDLVDDLIKAYNEFSYKVSDVLSSCCPDENLFPLHLILGSATQSTSAYIQDANRTYFIFSPLFARMGNESAEVVLLFNRMMIMVQQFTTQAQNQTLNINVALILRRLINIKITPSQYELPWLSDRAIPYYYNVNVSGAELYKSWNYYKTVHGSADSNLGFNANQYSANSAVVQPLLYDIEQYNFFRVEGHIGLNYQTALSNILSQRLTFNLPFDVMTISADLLSSDATLPQCNFQDLDTGYDLIVSEAACKIHTTFCFITKMPYTPPPITIATGTFVTKQFINTGLTLAGRAKTANAIGVSDTVLATTAASSAAASAASAASSATINLSNSVDFTTFKLNNIANLEPLLTLNTAYKKGDYMRKYCTPDANTIGSGYLNSLSSTGVFTNPIQLDQSNPLTIAYFYLFAYVEAVEQLMFVLQTNTLSEIDMTAFAQQYLGYLAATATAIGVLEAMTVQNATAAGAAASPFVTLAEDLGLDMLVGDLVILTSICIDERLQVLKDEYNRRLKQYQDQHTFINYYKNNPGLEHKGGVPKGGTLVLVYHSGTQATTTATPPVITGPILTTPPILTGPVLTTPPVVTGPVLTTPPVVTGPVLTHPPVETGPVLSTPVINPPTSGPILTTPVSTPPASTGPILNTPVGTTTGTTAPILNTPVGTTTGTTAPILNIPVGTTTGTTAPILNTPVGTTTGTTGTVLNSPTGASPVLATPIAGTTAGSTGAVLKTPVVGTTVGSTGTVLKTPVGGASPILNSPILAGRAIPGTTIDANPALGATLAVNPVLTSTSPTSQVLSSSTLLHQGLTANAPLATAALDSNTLNSLRTFVNTLQNSDQKQLLVNILATQPVAQTQPQYNIPDGAVIADFYIPYLCCSDCPPIAYVLPPPPVAPPEKPVITMATTFCDNATSPQSIQVSAPGGTFNEVKGLDGTNLTFTPSTAGPGTYNIVYTLNGVASDPVAVTVLKTPSSDFKFAFKFITDATKKPSLHVAFTAVATGDGLTYKWKFGPSFSLTESALASQSLIATFNTDQEIDTFATLVASIGGLDCGVQGVTKKLAITANGITEIPATTPKAQSSAIKSRVIVKKKKKGDK